MRTGLLIVEIQAPHYICLYGLGIWGVFPVPPSFQDSLLRNSSLLLAKRWWEESVSRWGRNWGGGSGEGTELKRWQQQPSLRLEKPRCVQGQEHTCVLDPQGYKDRQSGPQDRCFLPACGATGVGTRVNSWDRAKTHDKGWACSLSHPTWGFRQSFSSLCASISH